MKLGVGDLVHYVQDPARLGIVTMIHTTSSGADVCEVILVLDNKHPETLGEKRYSNQDYWQKIDSSAHPLDASIAGHEDEYEEIIDLHKTYGES